MEDINEGFEEMFNVESILKDSRMQEILYDLKIKLANENYNMIVENGIDFKAMKSRGISAVPLINTLKDMLEIFIELEEYEKCTEIKKFLDIANEGA